MNKIVEELLIGLIKRIENLEEKIGSMQKIADPIFPGMATQPQLKLLKNLGAVDFEGLTKSQAGIEIDRLMKSKKQKESEKESIGSKKLTKKELIKIENEGGLL